MFAKISVWTARQMGRPAAFVWSCILCVVWAICGPIFHYSDTWQLVINTATTVLTFLAVFLIQNTQNRDNEAVQLKLDELIRSHADAHNQLMGLETQDDAAIEQARKELHGPTSPT